MLLVCIICAGQIIFTGYCTDGMAWLLAPVAAAADAAVDVFTFGIDAGPASCGQLLLAFDLLGMFDQFKPKFIRRYANIAQTAVDALKTYAAEVRAGQFPDADHSYGMKPEEAEKLQRLLGKN